MDMFKNGSDKMEDIIKMLFSKYICTSKSENDFICRIEEIEEKLRKILNQEEMSLFIDYVDMNSQYLGFRSAQVFKQGFWVGCEIMREMGEA
jgi:hypothetical protein